MLQQALKFVNAKMWFKQAYEFERVPINLDVIFYFFTVKAAEQVVLKDLIVVIDIVPKNLIVAHIIQDLCQSVFRL